MSYDVAALAARIKAVPFRHWERLALDAGVSTSLPRKVVYEPERNFGIKTLQPLADYFRRVDAGEATLPSDPAPATPEQSAA